MGMEGRRMTTDLERADKPATKMIRILDQMAPKLQEAAAEGMDAKRLIRVFGGLATRNPKIYDCTPESVINAMVLCAQTGLEPGGYPPLVDLIPRRNGKTGTTELNWQIGYRGLVVLAQRSGEIARVAAAPVYDWEIAQGLFEYQIEPPLLLHRAALKDVGDMDARNVIGAYAIAEFHNGQRAQIFLHRGQIEERRKMARDQNVWTSSYPAMARKSAIRALFSGGTVPLQRELRVALEMEHEQEDMPSHHVQAQPVATSRTMFDVSVPVAELATPETPPELPPKPAKVKKTPVPEPPAETPYQAVKRVGADMGASMVLIDEAAHEAGVSPRPEEWTDADADLVLATLERRMGA